MRRPSPQNLIKQVSQVADFYGKQNVTHEDFFRYKKSPFLARMFFDKKCSNRMFTLIADKMVVNATHSSQTYDSTNPINVESLDQKRNMIFKIYYSILSTILFVVGGIFLCSSAKIQWSVEGILSGLFTLVFFGLIIMGIIINPLTQKIADWLISSDILFKRLISFLSVKFLEYQMGLEYWQTLTWQDFEKEVTRKFVNLGYDATNTKFSGDEGVDIIITDRSKKFIVQCKAMKNKIGPSYIRDFLGTMVIQQAAGGMIVALNGFSSGAMEATSCSNLHLVPIQDFILLDRSQLRKLIGW